MLLTALIMGIAGSLHCAGMCSPLAMTVSDLHGPAMRNRILYNIGRITTYGIIGAVVATIGFALPISGYQNILAIALGSMLIVLATVGMTGVRVPFITSGVVKFTNMVKNVFSKFIQRKNSGAMVLLGALNGLLPCGLTFLAASFCVTLTTPLEGFLYMLTFGVGTLPVMLGFVSVLDLIKNRLHLNIKAVTTGLMVLSGILLIARVFFIHTPEGHLHSMDVVDIVVCR